MDISTLETTILNAKNLLLQLVSESCYNKLPDKCLYILTFYNNSDLNLHKQRVIRKAVNDNLKPQHLAVLLPQLLSVYNEIYNLELFLYKTNREFNIIEVHAHCKSLLEPYYDQTFSDICPGVHCKIAIPFYHSNTNSKFNANWEHQTLRNRMYLLWNKVKYLTGSKHYNHSIVGAENAVTAIKNPG